MTILHHPWWSHDSHVTWTWPWCHWSSSMMLTSSWQLCSSSLLLSPSLLTLPSNESSSCWRLPVPAEAREMGELDPSRVDVEALPSSPPVCVTRTLSLFFQDQGQQKRGGRVRGPQFLTFARGCFARIISCFAAFHSALPWLYLCSTATVQDHSFESENPRMRQTTVRKGTDKYN